MRNLICFWTLILAGASSQSSATADDWMFRPSYYSHVPDISVPPDGGQAIADASVPFPQPMPRSAYRPAFTQLGPGFAVRNTYRFNVYRLWSGRSFDTTIYRQFSLEGTASR